MDRYEYAIWGIYGDDSSESLLATHNRQGQFLSSKEEVMEVIDDMKKAIEQGKFMPVRNVRVQAINMTRPENINSMFIKAINI